MDRRTAGRPGKGTRALPVSRSKYGNRKTKVCGITFDSKHEAERYLELKAMEKAGVIRELELQKPFLLIPAQKLDGKVVERAVKYVADFTYRTADGIRVVEDAKGCRTEVYKLKRKMMLWILGIRIREV